MRHARQGDRPADSAYQETRDQQRQDQDKGDIRCDTPPA
jgi:hypothetical protein